MIAKQNGLISIWTRYWFKPSPLLDLAILRLLAVGMQVWLLLFDHRYGRQALRDMAALPDSYYMPLPALKLLLLPFGGAEPGIASLEIIYLVACVSGCLALIGLFTNVSLGLFALCSLILQLWMVSHSDIHHPEAVMMIALAVLALGPSGRRLSIDSFLAARGRKVRPQQAVTDGDSIMARWPILIVQWMFVFMYASAAYAKIRIGGWDWPNGFTLQYYLAGHGLLNDAPLGVWMSQFHVPVLLSQWGVLLFQLTFILSMIFTRLKWIYVPVGMFMHFAIYLLLAAPFFQWIALYGAFIPWTDLGRWMKASAARSGREKRMPIGSTPIMAQR